MHWAERTLLYVVSVTLAGVLLWDHGRPLSPIEPSTPLQRPTVGPAKPTETEKAASKGDGKVSEIATPTQVAGDSTLWEIKDPSGKRRLALQADNDGASIKLLSAQGAPLLELSAKDSSARLDLSVGVHRATLEVDGVGKAEWSLQRGGDSMRGSLQDEGARLELLSPSGSRARLATRANGEAEWFLTSDKANIDAALIVDPRRGAELTLRERESQRGPVMTLLPTGDMGIAAKGPDGKLGPMLQLRKSGLAEVSVTGSDGRSGPGMMLLPDGAGAVFVRAAEGEHGPSLLMLPDGTAQISAVAANGTAQAALRTDRDNIPSVRVVDSKGKETLFPPRP